MYLYEHTISSTSAQQMSKVTNMVREDVAKSNVKDGQILFGIWQDLYFCEFDGPRNRHFYVTILEG